MRKSVSHKNHPAVDRSAALSTALGAVVAFNLPAYFPLVWRIASPWFNEDIKSKIVFPPRHLHDADAVMDWLDEKERKREKPFALTYRQIDEFGDLA